MKMMKTGLAATTALCLSMSMAYADDNKAFLDQDGDNNSASVDQSGSSQGQAGRTGKAMFQDGDNNSIDILQTATQNRTGVASSGTNGEITQTGSRNVLDIEQGGSLGDNQTVNVIQTAPDGLSGVSNTATIKQLGNYGGIGTVSQTSAVSSSSVMNTMTLTQKGGNSIKIGSASQQFTGAPGDTGNTMTIMQNGPTNKVNAASQVGYDNLLDITQTGGRTNLVSLASQNGSGNLANLSFDGDYNGNAGFTSGGAAEAAGAAASAAVQIGTDNRIGMSIIANSNQFGFYQNGHDNQATGISITGDMNELGVWQDGTSNMLTLAAITGTENNLGIRQDGIANQASLTVNGDQNGGYNGFGANIAGTLANGMGMTAGLVDQNGDNNRTTLNISGNGNVFATLQDNTLAGSIGNRINGTQNNTGGTGNQAAVAQVGDNNGANFSQVGSGNVTAVSQ